MTAHAEPATIDEVRAKLDPLVDEYLDAHPEIVEQYNRLLDAVSDDVSEADTPATPDSPTELAGDLEDDIGKDVATLSASLSKLDSLDEEKLASIAAKLEGDGDGLTEAEVQQLEMLAELGAVSANERS
ncbi:hypothetical protein [Actinophytocola sp.]|uniref:hypothetical protein n=1 Tax=Actinophytocola sp. TaxID=1872138 RepID=UPI003D6A68B4